MCLFLSLFVVLYSDAQVIVDRFCVVSKVPRELPYSYVSAILTRNKI